MMYNTSFSCLRLICLKGLKSANLGTSLSILTSDSWFTHFPLKKREEKRQKKQNKTKQRKQRITQTTQEQQYFNRAVVSF